MTSSYKAEDTTLDDLKEIPEEELQKMVESVEKREDFTELFKTFKDAYSKSLPIIDSLSKNSLKRLLKKVMGFPIEDGNITLVSSVPLEKYVWESFCIIEQSKIQMMVEDMRLNAEKELKEIEDAAREKIDKIEKEESDEV